MIASRSFPVPARHWPDDARSGRSRVWFRAGGRASAAQYQYVLQGDSADELYSWALIPAVSIFGFGLLLQHTRFRRLP